MTVDNVVWLITSAILGFGVVLLGSSFIGNLLDDQAAANTQRFDVLLNTLNDLSTTDQQSALINVYMEKDETIVAFEKDTDTKVASITRPRHRQCTSGVTCVCACLDEKCEQLIECVFVNADNIRADSNVVTQRIDQEDHNLFKFVLHTQSSRALFLDLTKDPQTGDIYVSHFTRQGK